MTSYLRQQPAQVIICKHLSYDSAAKWPDTRLGPLEPVNKRFPLPGRVGGLVKSTVPSNPAGILKSKYDSDIFTVELAHERQSVVLEQFVTVNKQLLGEKQEQSQCQDLDDPKSFNQFECVAHECPHFLFRDFCDIFPSYNANWKTLTVITLGQKPQERVTVEQLTDDAGKAKVMLVESFIEAATDICEVLHEAGFWADFIDPTSGRPYIGNHLVTAAGYEADDRYRRFGFEIQTSGACKVLLHHTWGSRPYVGCLFTTTPLTHPLIKSVIHKDK